jgi:dTDP-4-dehydrorhamnose 3,5-epimerase
MRENDAKCEVMAIPGVIVKTLTAFTDARGWLMELYRDDELPGAFEPAMSYLSMTHPGIARGPHEHREQTDGFVFMSGSYKLYLWDNRPGHEARQMVMEVGEANPVLVTIPPGVVHAYRNVGESDAFVINLPDRLYKGWDKKEEVDEIRHEDDAQSRFQL